MRLKIGRLIVSVAICLLAGAIGSFFTAPAIETWYGSLNKPAFTPPGWLFAPAWTILYMLMGISLYLVWQKGFKKNLFAIKIFFLQLVLNAAWSIIFFGLKNPTFAFLEITGLWLVIILTIKVFLPISKIAAYLLVPYLLWVTFASFLNLSIVFLN
ncbi:TspO protein [Candidatus Curtissbacteria bacterium RIFCSPHIGHO2_02_FULL_42_15]|uniref:TspO protein n=1 Tax=Candidatus Curtissbacteria bacterium RIFCSPHIGHO2_02_FULL_42_15 TaxID=1797716 RepID=A0A1F5GCU6_9BACT|nr:MAG: TspO protein [Candidatus Curtissbacteria bacterium RIFCSPHIGHO2_02_FULL_42_15]